VNERWEALRVLASHFPVLSDKVQAWDDQIRLICETDNFVRWGAVVALGSAFANVPDKKQAWDDLHKITCDTDSFVRWGAANAVSACYSHIPEEFRKQAWDDLHRLVQDKDTNVRITANHSSGRVSILRAIEADEDGFRKEMENALMFFEKASREATYDNPAKFCLPFYRSFFAITFKNEKAEAEMQKYLSEAKSAVEGSESKEKLLEAIENLGNALKEVQKSRDFNDVKADLKAYRRYCDRACELLDTTEEKAPGASRLIRKGLPIIDRTIKELISELKTKSRDVCIQTKDKPQNKIATEIYSEIKKLDAENPVKFDYYIDILTESLKMKIPNVKGNEHILENIEALRFISESDYKSLISKLIPIIGAIPQVVIERDQINIENFKGNFYTGSINSPNINQKKEQNMSININSSGTQSRVNIGSVDKSTNLITGDLKTDLENLNNLIESDYHKEDKPEIVQVVDQIKRTCVDSSKKNALKEKLGWILTRTSEVSSISSLVIALLQTYTGK